MCGSPGNINAVAVDFRVAMINEDTAVPHLAKFCFNLKVYYLYALEQASNLNSARQQDRRLTSRSPQEAIELFQCVGWYKGEQFH
jgi:hypothetical protein